MGASLVNLHQVCDASQNSLAGLDAYLSQLVGEPFRFARVSYGDELTLHFGDLRPGRSPKVRHLSYGAYILGLRASSWVLKSGTAPLIVASDAEFASASSEFGKPLSKEELEAGKFVEPESRVLSTTAFEVKIAGEFGLQLRMSDGSALLVLPAIPESDDPRDAELPQLAAWELSSPQGLLSAGPGLTWSFKPKEGTHDARH